MAAGDFDDDLLAWIDTLDDTQRRLLAQQLGLAPTGNVDALRGRDALGSVLTARKPGPGRGVRGPDHT